jgi:hypothetical protein
LGIDGGTSGASSSAWQNSSRDASASSLQQLRDRTQQSASALRSQRSTFNQTVRQGESMRVQTEVVANHNHCHAITIEYFEVLRHFLVRQRLADEQECLLVPLLMTRFDAAKARRWREPLTRHLRNRAVPTKAVFAESVTGGRCGRQPARRLGSGRPRSRTRQRLSVLVIGPW